MKNRKINLQLFADEEPIVNFDKIEKLQLEARDVLAKFDKCTQYKQSKGILEDAKRSVDFYEGRQWKDFKTKLPFEKPTINIILNMVDSKAASILNKTWVINYVVNDDMASTKKINKFTEWQLKELKQDELNARLTYDGLHKGTMIAYLYWDEDAIGQMGVMDGAVKATTIDIQDIAVSNPTNTDVQTQEWIIVHSRESVRKVKQLCNTLTNEEKTKYILPTNYDSIYSNDVEQENEVMTDVYTKLFKKNGEVYFQKSTKEILFQEAKATNPYITKEILRKVQLETLKEKDENDLSETKQVGDAQNIEMMTQPNDKYSDEQNIKMKLKASVYPIAISSFIKRDRCIFGVSFTAQLIAVQKNVNQLIATNLLTASKSAMPTIVVKQGALGTQSLDFSKPGRVVVDYSPPGVDGIKALNLGTLPTSHYELAQALINTTKDVYKTNDILNDGRDTAKNMSGYAMSIISSLQDKPIAQWQQDLARIIEQEGRILECFYKLNYRNKRFTSSNTPAEMLKAKQEGKDLPISTTDVFNGVDYLETPFNVSVEVSEGAKTSETAMVGLLESLFLNGTIEKLSPDTLNMWVELIPASVFPAKNELRLLIQERKNSIIAQKDEQIMQLTQQLQEVAMRERFKEQEYNGAIQQYNAKLKSMSQDAKAISMMQQGLNRQQNNNAPS